jgi:alkylation response protein AidB-like acyl-CoA dehydrogenase
LQLEHSNEQQAIVDAVGALLEQNAGPARAIELHAKGDYDYVLDAALAEAGFAEVALADGAGLLEAVLVSEATARTGGVVATPALAIAAVGLCGRAPAAPVALANAGTRGPVRFAAHARTLLVADADEARVVSLVAGEAEPVASSFGYPMGRLHPRALEGGDALGAGSGERLRDLWRLALATEILGTASACLDVTVNYLKQRRQFGRAIGSFQAVQHRLAECAVMTEGVRWLTYEAAGHDAEGGRAATAVAYAAATAQRVFDETHQLSGAIGFTREHDLHVWSMRLQALRLELGGVAAHRRAIAEKRWS